MLKKADVYSGSIMLYRDIEIADRFFPRFMGLMGRSELKSGGMHLIPCNSVHMFFMKFPLDIVFLSEEGEVMLIIEELTPGKVSPIVKGARSVLELPAGAARRTGLKTGEYLAVKQSVAAEADGLTC